MVEPAAGDGSPGRRHGLIGAAAAERGDRDGPAMLLRREFVLPAAPVRARLYVSAHGVYEMELNGERVGDHVLAPGWTSYHHRLRYQTFDVTGHLKAGGNALGAWLDAGYLTTDFASSKLEAGIRHLADGTGAHYPMLTSAVGTPRLAVPDKVSDLGFFALPGDDAAKNGLTVWEPAGVYIPKTTTGAKLDAARRFLAFVASKDGCDAMARATTPFGPFLVKGCTLPADVAAPIKDMQPYFDSGANSPALEFLSPVKGPSLEQITVEVGSGIRKAADGAALYDQDVKKQAQQLGLPGW
ncbi:alpha-L-rhamnosidase N-terminal domain-containing protein [Dactylosporangium sp. CA-139066]|uniref:alpha-L-rhamnosidase N-terminal domain-containing protein n=1 Tax=Dactylosporangium sp. CA-139066 TaxID=3239930 RepID=UPI003D9226F9